MGRAADAIVVLVRGDSEVASWQLGTGDRLELSVVDDLARLQVAAGRAGLAVRLRSPGVDLLALLELVGLAGVFSRAGSGQAVGESECGEQAGVEKVVVTDDPIT